MFKYSLIIALSLVFFSCDSTSKEQNVTESELSESYNEIKALSESVDCIDPLNWKFVGLGHKACGGPSGYIAYSIAIDTVLLLDMVEIHNNMHRRYNIENGVISDCSIVNPPHTIDCVEGKAILTY